MSNFRFTHRSGAGTAGRRCDRGISKSPMAGSVADKLGIVRTRDDRDFGIVHNSDIGTCAPSNVNEHPLVRFHLHQARARGRNLRNGRGLKIGAGYGPRDSCSFGIGAGCVGIGVGPARCRNLRRRRQHSCRIVIAHREDNVRRTLSIRWQRHNQHRKQDEQSSIRNFHTEPRS